MITGFGSGMAAIPYIGMVCWMSLAVISFFGYVP